MHALSRDLVFPIAAVSLSSAIMFYTGVWGGLLLSLYVMIVIVNVYNSTSILKMHRACRQSQVINSDSGDLGEESNPLRVTRSRTSRIKRWRSMWLPYLVYLTSLAPFIFFSPCLWTLNFARCIFSSTVLYACLQLESMFGDRVYVVTRSRAVVWLANIWCNRFGTRSFTACLALGVFFWKVIWNNGYIQDFCIRLITELFRPFTHFTVFRGHIRYDTPLVTLLATFLIMVPPIMIVIFLGKAISRLLSQRDEDPEQCLRLERNNYYRGVLARVEQEDSDDEDAISDLVSDIDFEVEPVLSVVLGYMSDFNSVCAYMACAEAAAAFASRKTAGRLQKQLKDLRASYMREMATHEKEIAKLEQRKVVLEKSAKCERVGDRAMAVKLEAEREERERVEEALDCARRELMVAQDVWEMERVGLLRQVASEKGFAEQLRRQLEALKATQGALHAHVGSREYSHDDAYRALQGELNSMQAAQARMHGELDRTRDEKVAMERYLRKELEVLMQLLKEEQELSADLCVRFNLEKRSVVGVGPNNCNTLLHAEQIGPNTPPVSFATTKHTMAAHRTHGTQPGAPVSVLSAQLNKAQADIATLSIQLISVRQQATEEAREARATQQAIEEQLAAVRNELGICRTQLWQAQRRVKALESERISAHSLRLERGIIYSLDTDNLDLGSSGSSVGDGELLASDAMSNLGSLLSVVSADSSTSSSESSKHVSEGVPQRTLLTPQDPSRLLLLLDRAGLKSRPATPVLQTNAANVREEVQERERCSNSVGNL